MIREFSSKAKPSNNKANLALGALFTLAALSLLCAMLMERYGGLVELLTVALIVAAVVIYTKYVAAVYYYEVTFDYAGTPVFVVRQLTGKRETTLARLGIAEIISVTSESREERGKHNTPHGTRKYTYVPTLSPEQTLRITYESPYERAELIIEAPAEFGELLLSYAEEARRDGFYGEK